MIRLFVLWSLVTSFMSFGQSGTIVNYASCYGLSSNAQGDFDSLLITKKTEDKVIFGYKVYTKDTYFVEIGEPDYVAQTISESKSELRLSVETKNETFLITIDQNHGENSSLIIKDSRGSSEEYSEEFMCDFES